MSSAYYKGIKRSREKELSDYKKRKTQLEKVNNAIVGDFNDNVSDIARQARKAAENLENALSISVSGSKTLFGQGIIPQEYFCMMATGDYNTNECYGYVQREIVRVRNKISELEQEIASLKRTIQREEERERKEREEKLKELLGVK